MSEGRSSDLKLNACVEQSHLVPVFIRQLKKLASLGESASVFLHCVFDDICGRSLGYAQFGAAHELQPVVSSWRDFLSLAVGHNLTSDQITADLTACGLADTFSALVVQAIDARRGESRPALVHNASKLATNSLKDFDWSMRMVLSSDKISSMSEPLVLLRLTLAGDRGDQEVTLELTKVELDRLLATCGNIQHVLDRLKA